MRKGVLLAGLVLLLVAASATAVSAQEQVKTIRIGVLVDLSGPLTTYGTDIWHTLQIAKKDINNYFEKKGLPYRVQFYVEDTKVDPKVCLEKIQDLYAKGINIIIGPMGSGEVKNIKDFVTSNKIIIISPSSTALPSLLGITKPSQKKYIFRFVGTDDLQTDAIAAELKDLGIKAVVITYIGNAWGRGLYETIKPKLEKEGIKVVTYVEYPDPPPADFSPYIAELTRAVTSAIKEYGRAHVGVVAFSYEEVATMLAQTNKNSPLLTVLWFGSDGCAESSQVLKVCDKAERVKLLSTLFQSKGKAFEKLKEEYEKAGYGKAPYQYAMNAYDAAWVLALSYVQVIKEKGKYDPDAMAAIIPKVTKEYSEGKFGVYPVTGYIELNKWNDRASGDYAIYYVSNQCKWDTAGVWKFATNKIIWFHKPTLPALPTTTVTTTQAKKKTPGFPAALAVVGLLAAAYLLRRR